MLFGYVRVSTNDQNTDLQRNALNCAGCELIFEDKISSAMGVRHYNWLLKINKFCIVVMILPSCYKVWILAKLLYVKPITIKKANEFVSIYHRHHRPTSRNSGRWAIAAYHIDSDELVGVAIVGNPVSATYMDGVTAEITRLCVSDKSPKGTCSFLISRCSTIWKMMGGEKIITYTLSSETGASLKGAGWQLVGTVHPHNRWADKAKQDGIIRDNLEIYKLKKFRWECLLGEVLI